MLINVVTVDTDASDLEAIRVRELVLPWAYSAADFGFTSESPRVRNPDRRPHRYASTGGSVADPASDGKSYMRARRSLEWFLLGQDGLSVEFPHLSRVSVLRTTTFVHDELEALHAEIQAIMPYLIGDDELLFDAVNFLIEEVLAHGRGGIEFRPDIF